MATTMTTAATVMAAAGAATPIATVLATNDTYRTLTKTEGKWFCLLLSADLYVCLFVLFPLSIILKSTLNQTVYEHFCVVCVRAFWNSSIRRFFSLPLCGISFIIIFFLTIFVFVFIVSTAVRAFLCFFFFTFYFICYDFTFTYLFSFSLSLCLSLIPIRWLLFNKCASASAYSLYSGAIINDSLALNASMAIAVCVLCCAGWAQSARARMYTLGEHSYVSSNRTREVTQMAISQLFK